MSFKWSRWLKYHHSTLFQQITEKYSKISSCHRRYHRFCTLGISRWTLHEIDHDHLSIGGDRLWILEISIFGVNSIKLGLIEIWLSNSSQRSAAHLIRKKRGTFPIVIMKTKLSRNAPKCELNQSSSMKNCLSGQKIRLKSVLMIKMVLDEH